MLPHSEGGKKKGCRYCLSGDFDRTQLQGRAGEVVVNVNIAVVVYAIWLCVSY